MPNCWIAIDTVEICVLLLIAAAAVLAAAMNRTQAQSVETVLVAGTITCGTATTGTDMLTFSVTDSFDLLLKRSALPQHTIAAALAITIKGHDISIEERLQQSNSAQRAVPPAEAVYIITCLKPRTRYHIHYNSATNSTHGAFGLVTESGYSGTCALKL